MAYDTGRLKQIASGHYDYDVAGHESIDVLLSAGYFSGVPSGSTVKTVNGALERTRLNTVGYVLTISEDGTAAVAGSVNIQKSVLSGMRAVLFGDSITRYNSEMDGAGLNRIHGGRGYFIWAQVLMGFPFHYEVGNDGVGGILGDNRAISGETTAENLSRIQDVLDRNPDIVFYMCGTNDITDDVPSATIISNLNTIITTFVNRGILVVLMPILPRSGASDWESATQRQTHHVVNRWLRDKAKRTNGIIMIDPYSIWVDATSANGDLLATYSADGLHPNPRGAYVIGNLIKEELQHLAVPTREMIFSASDVYDASTNIYGNMLPNGLLAGTAGTKGTGASGDVADSYTIYRTGGTAAVTVVGSKIAHSDGNGGAMQRLTIDSTGAGAAGTTSEVHMGLVASTVTGGCVNGEWYEALCEVNVSATDGGLGVIRGVYLELAEPVASTRRNRCLTTGATGDVFPTTAWSGVLRTPPIQVTDATAGLRPRIVNVVYEDVNSTFTVDVGRVTLRRLQQAPSFV